MATISLLIATIDAGIRKVDRVLLEPRPEIDYYISHQVTGELFRKIPESLKTRSDVQISQIKGRGLSRNRNHLLDIAMGDLALLADDDARYRMEYFETLRRIFAENQDIDVACFKIATPEGYPEYKEYSEESFLLNYTSRHYISSLEVAFRLSTVKKMGLKFDERFGAGSEYVTYGEEAVFIHDCIKAGLRVKYFPEYIVEHSAESTVRKMDEFDQQRIIFKGAYDARRYGLLAFPAAFAGTFTQRQKLIEAGVNPFHYLGERLRGAAYILRSKAGVEKKVIKIK